MLGKSDMKHYKKTWGTYSKIVWGICLLSLILILTVSFLFSIFNCKGSRRNTEYCPYYCNWRHSWRWWYSGNFSVLGSTSRYCHHQTLHRYVWREMRNEIESTRLCRWREEKVRRLMLESEIEWQKICESDTVREWERARETFRGKMKPMNWGNVSEKCWRRPS